MLIKVLKNHQPRPSEITTEEVYHNRRKLIKHAYEGLLLANLGPFVGQIFAADKQLQDFQKLAKNPKFQDLAKDLTSFEDITNYNNFYEFGTGKGDPARNAKSLRPEPWTVKVAGHAAKGGDFKVNVGGSVRKPANYHLEDLIDYNKLEERIYRFRCVEAWSMVVPWVGVPLAQVLRRVDPQSKAKYVQFKTLHDPEQMPGQRRKVLDWPYTEGLRLDEAMHDLTLLVVGVYGKILPNQNGAPLRLIVPWKYGFKSIKSIVSINLVENEPMTTWMKSGPSEYFFYSNVNPDVPHPRWSQKTERVLGAGFFSSRKKTLHFNGYGDDVAAMYSKFDNKKLY